MHVSVEFLTAFFYKEAFSHTKYASFVAIRIETGSKVGGFPVAQSIAVEPVVSDDRSLLVHSHGGVLLRECAACVVGDSETGTEHMESRNVAW